MTFLREGDISFTFTDAVWVRKLDDTSFYRERILPIAEGIKAVDFVYRNGDSPLCFLEVKDYRKSLNATKQDIDARLEGQLIKKLLWSFSVLYAAGRGGHSGLTYAESRFLTPSIPINFIVFLETPPRAGNSTFPTAIKLNTQNDLIARKQNLALAITQKIRPFRVAFALYDSKTLPHDIGWSVQLHP